MSKNQKSGNKAMSKGFQLDTKKFPLKRVLVANDCYDITMIE